MLMGTRVLDVGLERNAMREQARGHATKCLKVKRDQVTANQGSCIGALGKGA
jgi:hypothetical protein